ncbi:MAG: histidine phosphatase family protein [Magnetococcales bacterium]|nr:histidine phosphatase family protein [Magnetococcales bacterium]
MTHPGYQANLTTPVGMVDLIRHGEVEGGACFRGSLDDPLTAKGRKTMESTLEMLAPWDRIVTSPLSRCYTVAKEFSRKNAVPLVVEKGFREICFGEWEGKTAKQIMASDGEALKLFWQNPDKYSPPGGEKTADFSKRVMASWCELIANKKIEHKLIITHGGVIKAILADILGITLLGSFALEVPLSSVSRIYLHTDKDGQNITPHLAFMGLNL